LLVVGVGVKAVEVVVDIVQVPVHLVVALLLKPL
jgi:hypothetical protein